MANTKLFDLIHVLSMSEKRFFKIFSSRHVIGEENDYVRLFSLIEKMTEYDEEAVRNASFVKNASAEKNYLYRLILKSLNAYNAQASARHKIYNQLHSAETLTQKGLYKQALGIVRKAKKTASENELFRQELVLSELEEELLLKELDYSGAFALLEADGKVLDKVDNLRAMTQLTTRGYEENLSRGVVRSESELAGFNDLIATPLLADSKEALSHRARLHQISVSLTYHMVSGNHSEVLKRAKQILKQYEKHPHLIDYTPVGYVSSNFILGAAQRDTNKYKDGLATAEKLGRIQSNKAVQQSSKAMASAFFYQHILALQIHLKTKKYEAATPIAVNALKELPKHFSFIGKPQLYDLYFQFCKLYFFTGKLKQALHFTNEILNDVQFKQRADFLITIRLFNLLVHYELGNEFTLEYLSRSTFSYLKKKSKAFRVEKLLIKFIERNHLYQGEALKEILSQLLEDLNECAKDHYENRALLYFDFREWIQIRVSK